MEHVIHVQTGNPYDVHILEAAGSLSEQCQQLAHLIAQELGSSPRFCLITDTTVDGLYGEAMMEALQQAGFSTDKLVFPSGEATKCLPSLGIGLEFLASHGMTRTDVVIALGGGVIGDLAGFTAATFLRGIRYVQIPTSLLACVDSTVGGKTAVDLAAGKNLAGAFHQPSLVLINEGFLSTLDDALLRDGLAEAIKCGLIGDMALFDFLQRLDLPALREPGVLTTIIHHAIDLKRRLVEADEKDHGPRQLLNLGHTIAHALEAASSLSISHGHAVASGMYLCARATESLGWQEGPVADALGNLLSRLGYPLVYPYDAATLFPLALADKKRRGSTMTLVIPLEVGHCALKELPLEHVQAFFEAALKDLPSSC